MSIRSALMALVLLLAISSVKGWVTTNSNCHSSLLTSNRDQACVRTTTTTTTTARLSPAATTTARTTTASAKNHHHRHGLFATVEEDEETIEYLDDDDDDDDDDGEDGDEFYDPVAASAKQARWMEELSLLSKTSARDPSAVARAQAVFDAMFQTYVETDDATFFPTTEVYNLILETHAYSHSPEGADEAEMILGRMEDSSNDFVARPNEETYLRVMDAWAVRREPSKAKAVLERQAEPSTNTYNKLIKAYGMTGDFAEAEAVFDTLRSEGKADQKSWVQLMKARVAASSSNGDDNDNDGDDDDMEDAIRSYLEEMEDDGLEPDTDAYNVLIRCIGDTKPNGPQKAEAMLFELIERFRSNGEDHVKPNAGTFRAVLLAYKNTIRGKAGKQIAAKAEQLLQIREGLKAASAAASSAVDEIALAEIAMGMISRSKDPRKTVRVHRILSKHLSAGGLATQRMHKLVLEAAASTTSGNAEEKLEAFRIALDVYKEFREDGDGGGSAMNGSVVGLFLRACHRLLSNGQKRNDVVRAVFGEARDRGLVSGFVLGELDTAASEDLQLELLGGFVVDGVNIPEAWKRNVPDPR